jgi:hypothetical protein
MAIVLVLALLALAAAWIDLTDAVVTSDLPSTRRLSTALRLLIEEVEKRTRRRWPRLEGAPPGDRPVISVGELDPAEVSPGPEGYRLRSSARRVEVAGVDDRGILFGIGRLLRDLRMSRDAVRLPVGLDLTSAPRLPLRGHQLGYRPKTNSYDGWDLGQWEQYLRDLVVFGANAIELIPPRSDDDADSPHFPLPPLPMMAGMSRLADEYGLDVWIWYPAMDPDYRDRATLQAAEREWHEVFRALPRVDAVFVPGGDPGHTEPETLFTLLERQAGVLRTHHPGAGMWVSPQGFTADWIERFHGLLEAEPDWLTGVVYGPQVRGTLAELRARVPRRYPIRDYPDITHTRQCQYPAPDWDAAFALTEGREPINPRPLDQAAIFRATHPDTCGFITYSEGCNDDVNKTVWSALGWEPDADVVEVLRQYSRYFLGEEVAEPFAQALLGLERNWRGPLLANGSVEPTLHRLQALEREASPALRANWRFQQALYRGHYDAFVRRRLLYETHLEQRAMETLALADRLGSLAAMERAQEILGCTFTEPVAVDLRARIFELAEALFQSVRMQLSVPRYQAIDVGRGANLDTLDVPLNNRPWLIEQFARLRSLPDESARLAGIEEILHWTDPGPGGRYDALGSLSGSPHLVKGTSFDEDPSRRQGALLGYALIPGARCDWCRYAGSMYENPLVLRYEHLDPDADYRLRVLYSGDTWTWKVRLEANEGVEIHPFIEKPRPLRPLEFPVPQDATRGGTLTLRWTREPGQGGNGRGCQVSEVWLTVSAAKRHNETP